MLVRILLAVVVASSIGTQRGPASSTGPFILGVLQTNGSLIPFATFEGGKWGNAWPAPEHQPRTSAPSSPSVTSLESLPKTWTNGLPVPRQWHLWLPTRTAHAINVDRPRFVDSNCSQNWVLATDFPAGLASCRNCCPLGIIGVAVSTNRDLWTASMAGQLVPTEPVLRGLVALEPAEARLPTAAPLRIVRLWWVGQESLYYLEAQRTIPSIDSGGACQGLSLFRAWFRVDPKGQVAVISQEYEAADCDAKGSHFYEPLGVIGIDKVQYVIVQRNGWEEQAFGVLRIDVTSVKTMVMTDIR